MFAIIETGGKQYRAGLGGHIRVEKLHGLTGDGVLFDRVLLRYKEEGVLLGQPYLSGAEVRGTIIKQGRERKKIVFRYHSKNRYRKKKGHRQPYTDIEIQSIN